MSLLRLHRFFAGHELTRPNQSAAWLRFLVWQYRSRIQPEVIVPWIHGLHLAARRGMTGATGNIYAGLHEFRDMMFLLHFIRQDDVFVDVGANVGTYSLLASGVRGATSHAFEPDPATASLLRRNININDLANKIAVHQVALGESDEAAWFTTGLDTTNHIVAENGHAVGGVQNVQMRRADGALAGVTPAFLKIDVEGHEDGVILGARHLLQHRTLNALIIETVSVSCSAILRDAGFNIVDYDPFHRQLTQGDGAFGGRHNTLYVRDVDFVRRRLCDAAPVEVLGKSI